MELPDLQPITKKVNVRTGNGKVMGVVREHYLRRDIPCQSDLCFEGCCVKSTKTPLLPRNVTHYLLPLDDVAKNFFDVLDSRELTGIIFLQSVVSSIQLSSQRHYRKICQLVREPAKGSIFFPNEFSKHTALLREEEESVKDWKVRMAFHAANWFYEHLGGQKPIVVVTEDPQIVRRFETSRIEVFVLTLRDYLSTFWTTLDSLREAYDSLAEAQADREAAAAAAADEGEEYADYYKQEVLEAGLRQGRFVQGTLSVDKHASQEAFVSRHGDKSSAGAEAILVPGAVFRNRAVHGDLVVVQLLPKSEWRSKLNRLAEPARDAADEAREERWERRADVMPTGRVVGVAERNWREYIATIPREEAHGWTKRSGKRILVLPYDRRIPKIRVLTSQAQKLVHERVVVRIDSWPVNSQYPNGHFVRSLGKIGDLETEVDGILLENNISITPFSKGMLGEMPPEDWRPDEEEVQQKRKDLRRSHLVMSIDPKGCEDVDDTLSMRKLSNGNLELGVHIADVTHFLSSDSLTDLEARRRATTVYLADRRYDMLPSVLSSNVCSLLGGVDRYAVSVLWELEPETFAVVSVWYGRTVIRSSYKLCYEAAQEVLDGGRSAEQMRSSIPELSALSGQGLQKRFRLLRDSLVALSRAAQAIQDEREKRGALRLDSAEVQFEFEASSLSDIKPKAHLKVHETVAECMIFANHWVAKKISKAFPHQALLRRHPEPKKESFDELKKCASAKGWRVETWCNRVLSESLNQCQDPNDPTVNLLLRGLATYAMVQAVYFSTGSVSPEMWEHYGLALSHYTHFTSPIRRYADVVVHRLLLASLERQDWWSSSDNEEAAAAASKLQLLSDAELQELSVHVNDRNRAAQNAQRSSQTLFQTLYFKGKAVDDPRCIVEGVVLSIRANGFLVYIPRYALKGPVYMQNRDNQVLFYHANVGPVWQSGSLKQDGEFGICVETADGKRQTYRLFDHVTITIQMQGSDSHPHKLLFYLLSKRPPTKTKEEGKSSVNLERGEINFLKEIRKEMEEKETSEQMDLNEESTEAVLSNTRKRGKSMYGFFQRMKLMGLSTVD